MKRGLWFHVLVWLLPNCLLPHHPYAAHAFQQSHARCFASQKSNTLNIAVMSVTLPHVTLCFCDVSSNSMIRRPKLIGVSASAGTWVEIPKRQLLTSLRLIETITDLDGSCDLVRSTAMSRLCQQSYKWLGYKSISKLGHVMYRKKHSESSFTYAIHNAI